MRYLLFCFLWLSSGARAQKGLDGMVNAEISFSIASMVSGSREAFLNFLDSNGIVFDKGKPVNGIQHWKAKEPSGEQLGWKPEFAEISSSLDFGYTTGPWQYSKAPGEGLVAWGQYTTVWHLDNKGEWKFLVDLGTNHRPPWDKGLQVKSIDSPKLPGDSSAKAWMIKAENEFNKACRTNKEAAYRQYLSGQSMLNRHQAGPAVSVAEKEKAIRVLGENPYFEPTGYGMATGNDLGYVYGQSVLNGKKDNYLRIWRREASGWKIALEVARQ